MSVQHSVPRGRAVDYHTTPASSAHRLARFAPVCAAGRLSLRTPVNSRLTECPFVCRSVCQLGRTGRNREEPPRTLRRPKWLSQNTMGRLTRTQQNPPKLPLF